jgi:Uma2 family endonuclease
MTMGQPAEKPRRATYADLEAVPPNKVAEIINGVLHVFPRPAPPHARTASRLGGELMGPFDIGRGGPGGWHILDEPELHLGPADEEEDIVPNIAGWRASRMPKLPKTAYIALAPDWVCEVLGQRTEAADRAEKMPVYAREGVGHAWLIHPIRRTFEVFVLDTDRRWKLAAVHRGAARVRAEPFEELELDLALLWPDEDDEQEEDEENVTPAPPASKPKRVRTKIQKRPRKG